MESGTSSPPGTQNNSSRESSKERKKSSYKKKWTKFLDKGGKQGESLGPDLHQTSLNIDLQGNGRSSNRVSSPDIRTAPQPPLSPTVVIQDPPIRPKDPKYPPGTQWIIEGDKEAVDKAKREMMRENQLIMKEREKKKQEQDTNFTGEALEYIMETVLRIENRLTTLEHNQPTGPPTPILKKKQKIKRHHRKKERKSSSSSSSSDQEETDIEDPLFRFSNFDTKTITSPNQTQQDSSNWINYVDRKRPFLLPDSHWVTAWLNEGKPKLKVEYMSMARLQSKQSNPLKQLTTMCKEYGERITKISSGSSENYSLSNLARLARQFMVRFQIEPKLFPTVFVEHCLPPTLRSLALSNPHIAQQGESALLKWLQIRSLNKSSEIRLKRDIQAYLKKSLKEGRNVSTMISNVEAIMVPELLEASPDGYSSGSPESRALQCRRETRILLLDALEQNLPLAYRYLGISGEINEDLDIMAQKIESFLQFSMKDKMVAAVGKETEDQAGERTVMDKILDLEKGKTKTEDKLTSLRKKCKFHQKRGGIEACQQESRHCYHHSIEKMVQWPCEKCPQWMQLKFAKKESLKSE